MWPRFYVARRCAVLAPNGQPRCGYGGATEVRRDCRCCVWLAREVDVGSGLRFRGDCEAPVYREKQALTWPGAPGGKGADGSNRVRRLSGLDGGGGEFSTLCGTRQAKRSDPGDIGAGRSHSVLRGAVAQPKAGDFRSQSGLVAGPPRLLDAPTVPGPARHPKSSQRKLAELCQRPVRVVAAVHRIGSERRQGVSPPDTCADPPVAPLAFLFLLLSFSRNVPT